MERQIDRGRKTETETNDRQTEKTGQTDKQTHERTGENQVGKQLWTPVCKSH